MDSIKEILASTFWADIVRALVTVLAGVIAARVLGKIVDRAAKRNLDKHNAALLRKITTYAVLSASLLVALSTLGIKLSGLLAAAGLLTVALGFAAQTSVSNIISGFFLLMEKPFEVGDVVDIEGNVGVVLSLDLLSTKLRTFDNLFVRIPNENILKKSVKTFSKYQVRRIDIKFSIAYKEKITEAKEVVRDFLKSSSLVLEDPRPLIITRTLGDSGVDFVAKVWIDRTKLLEARDSVTAGIKKALDEAGIEIPFPHLTMYMGDPGQLRAQGRGMAPLTARSPKARALTMGRPRPPKRPRRN